MPFITLILCILFSSQVFSEELILWNRNYDTAPIDKILDLAFQKTEDLYNPIELKRSRPMEQGEALENLAKRSDLDLLSAAASASHEARFRTVRFPLLKGLLGHRLCLIRKGDQSRFNNIRTSYDFRSQNILVCQGADWPDTPILKRNGFKLKTSPIYTDMFAMLRSDECDCFLRGAQEIMPEYLKYEDEFAIERSLAVLYKQPGVLYVHQSQHALAARIELGLLRALDDGSFDQLINELLDRKIAQLNLESRRYIYLENPFLPDSINNLGSANELWYQP